MKKLLAMLLTVALLCGFAALAEDPDAAAGLKVNTLIEEGSFIIQIPVGNGDMGWCADDMSQDDSVVKLYDADVIEDTFVARYDAVGDGDVTVGVRHFYNGFACDQAMTWDLRVADGAVQEVIGGSQALPATEADLDPLLSGEWLEAETQFTRMSVEKNAAMGWDVEIVSPMTHGAYVFKTTVYCDCENDLVYDKGKYWEVPITDSDEEETDLGEAKVAGTTGSFAIAGTEEDPQLIWRDSQRPDEAIVFEPADMYEEQFAEWNADAPALNALIDYVEAVTDETSPDFIPQADRIAVFDMDGTLMGELYPTYLEYYMLAWRILKDPTFEPDAEMLEVGRTLRDCALDNSFPEDMPMQHAIQAARAYAGMTLPEFAHFVTSILVREADGFEGMTYGEAFYLPMVEVVEYLQENGFKCYVCSGSDRFICRTFIEGMVDIPYENIIGMDVALEATNQGDTQGLDYVYSTEDDVIRTDRLLIKNLKMNKVAQIAQEIGRQPVLSFGNSSGDVSMHNYTISNNAYRSAAFMLVADDDVRDYGDPEKGQGLKEKWQAAGFNVISMANDWKTIYGEDVVKTGSFHWLEELADDRTVEAGEAQPEDGVQYVIYLGTNDKDTGKPVFTQEEAKERAREILIENFGGYTLQEAFGGWIDDDGEECREYTLAIYLSDTTPEQVHAAADQLIEAFNQSSVLIQANPTQTEFYGGANAQ